MAILLVILIAFLLAVLFEDTILGILPYVIFSVTLILYVLAFFCHLSWIDGVLIVAAAAILVKILVNKDSRKKLKQAAVKQLCNPYLLCCIAVMVLMCFFTRQKQILEWDGFSFWGPDVKSLFYRDGFAPRYSNAAYSFGNYTPIIQLFWWFSLHGAGYYNETFLFWGYFVLGAIILFSTFEVFLHQTKGKKRIALSILVPICAVLLPGMADTTWYRAITVDPIIAVAFGMLLCLILRKPEKDINVWYWKLIVGVLFLTLTKQIAIVWALFVLLFYCLWQVRRKKDFLFVGCLGAFSAGLYESWRIFCRVMDRSGYLTTHGSEVFLDRLREIKEGVFFTSGNNLGYIKSYAKAFLFTSVHRENTLALDLTPIALLTLLFAAVIILRKIGFIPKEKFRRLIWFMVLTCAVIYAVVGIGQMTMFYGETQYLEPVKAVTLLCRYSSPAHIGLIMLAVVFASGQYGEAAATVKLAGRKMVAGMIAASLVLSCGAYTEIKRGFIFDSLDATRVEHRRSVEQTYEDFLKDIQCVPLDEECARVALGVSGTEINPILVNAASPVSFTWVNFDMSRGEELQALQKAITELHCGYVYINDGSEDLCSALSAYAGATFEKKTLYAVQTDASGDFSLQKLN